MKPLLLLFPALLVFGCVYQVNLSPDSTAEEFARADSLMRGRSATVCRMDSTRFRARFLDFRADSVFYVNLVTGEARSISSTEVDRVLSVNHARYTEKGALIGAIPGSIIGFLLAVFIGSTYDKCVDCSGRHADWGFLLPAGTLTGAFVGGGVGALAGFAAAPVYTVDYAPQY